VRGAAFLSAGDLLEQVWDEHADPFTNTVTVTIGRLRRKLGDPPIITTTPGRGYRIAPDALIGSRRMTRSAPHAPRQSTGGPAGLVSEVSHEADESEMLRSERSGSHAVQQGSNPQGVETRSASGR
jgi:DNA-binding winged helix-turn-helix (wHTH) protein